MLSRWCASLRRRLVGQPLRLLVLQTIRLDLPREAVIRFLVAFIALVVVAIVHMFEVRRPRHRRVEPLLVGARELAVEDGDGVAYVVALKRSGRSCSSCQLCYD